MFSQLLYTQGMLKLLLFGFFVLLIVGVWLMLGGDKLKILRDAVLSASPNPEVATISDGSRTHVNLNIDGDLIQVSTGSANFRKPFRRGDFAVWLEVPQEKAEKYVIRYHIPTQTQLRLTSTGVSQHARVNTQGAVVWQQWVADAWQVFYFDGQTTKQVTEGTVARINPDIYDTKIVYAERLPGKSWNLVEWSAETNKSTTVPNSEGEKYPLYEGDSLSFVSPSDPIILEADE